MKQVLQDIRSGEIAVHEVPEPGPAPGYALVAVRHSLISAGTERAMAGLGAKSLVQKARARPDLVRKTVETARSEGLAATAAKVRSRLDQYTAFGYSCAGEVLHTGGDAHLSVGQLVACVGQGYASHAEVVAVPTALVVPLPSGVSTADAAFAAPAAIAMHAIRLAGAEAGAVVAVVGLGLIGQLAGRLLRASGCTVVGTDPRDDRRVLFGDAADAEGAAALVQRASRRRGADAILVCAATAASGPVELAAALARDRAPIVVVGDVALELDRAVFYEKELSLVVARSYGPGRYDRDYEERGLDYPAGYVRWTESRNIEAVLDLIESGGLPVDDLVTHRYPIEAGGDAYSALNDPTSLGILLAYEPRPERQTTIRAAEPRPRAEVLRVGLVGAGAFARGTLIPLLDGMADVQLAAVCTRSGASARSVADKYAIPILSTDWHELVEDDEIDALVVATPHAEHASITAAALRHGKAVLVEKPLAVDRAGLADVAAAAAEGGLLLVGHNRRFAPLASTLKRAVAGPLLIQIRVAAGPSVQGHWLDDPEQGGRVLGEISHFVDLAAYLAGGAPSSVSSQSVGGSLLGSLRFSDGSAASIAYAVGESGRLEKERVEVFARGGSAVLDDFRRVDVNGRSAAKGSRDKGHRAQLLAFVAAARGLASSPVPLTEQLLVAEASLALLEAADTGRPVAVPADR